MLWRLVLGRRDMLWWLVLRRSNVLGRFMLRRLMLWWLDMLRGLMLGRLDMLGRFVLGRLVLRWNLGWVVATGSGDSHSLGCDLGDNRDRRCLSYRSDWSTIRL